MLVAICASIVLVSLACLVLLHRAGERHATLLAVLESTGDGILVVNSAGRIVGSNRRFADLWRIPESAVRSQTAAGLLRQVAGQLRDPDQFLHRVRQLYSDPEATADDLVELRDGRIYERHTEPQRFGGRIVGRVWRLHDVTEFRRVQARLEETKNAAESASRAKSEFLHNMSHEIRTPMNGVLGMLEIALDSELTAEQREHLAMAKMSAENLLAVVNDITDFSKIEAGKLEFDLVPFDICECVEKTAKSLALAAHQKNLEIVCNIAESVPRLAVGDAGRLRQVLINLIGNAIKFTEKGEVCIEVEGRLRQLEQTSLELRFAVRDSGIGIRPEHHRKIFESFSQADPSTTRLYGGSGLGLTISQRLVELMGGHIWVESEPGRGSTFRFTLPVGIDDTTMTKPDRTEICLGGMKVLIIDGNANTRRVLVDYVSRWGARVCSAETGLEAAQIIRSMASTCDVVIAGAQAPGIQDFLLASPVGACRGLILMLTAGRNPVEVRHRRAFGAATLTKPLGQAELLETILRVSAALHDGPSRLARMGAIPPVSPAGRASSRSIRILLAEDNPVNQKVAARLLEKDGHHVKVVSNGREAVAALEHEAFELVLMDLEMPVMDGLKTATVIREREQLSGGHLPIIAMTAHAMSGDRDRCLAAGMDDYITKPIRKVDLAQIISHQLGSLEASGSLTAQCAEGPSSGGPAQHAAPRRVSLESPCAILRMLNG